MRVKSRSSPRRMWACAAAAMSGLLLAAGCVSEDVLTVTIGTVVVTPGTASLLEGEMLQFRSSVEDDAGRALPRATVAWTSDNPAIASVDSNGMVTALAAGNASVTADFRGVTGSATVTVIPAPAVALDVDTAAFLGAVGGSSMAPVVLEIQNGGGGILGGLAVSVTYGSGQPEGWLQLTLGSTQAPTTLTLEALLSSLPVGMYDAVISLSSPDDPNSPFLILISLSLTGFTITETGGSTLVTEAGSADTVSVVLDALPDSVVVLTVTSADPGEVTASPAALTFTPGNWNVPQIVVVTGQDEMVSDGDQVTPLVVSVDDDLSDSRYAPIPDDTVSVTTADDDAPSFTVTQSGGVTNVTEAGSTDVVSVVLDVQPLSPVVFDVSISDSTEVSSTPAVLIFSPQDWSTPQEVTVTGVDDDILDGTQSSQLRIAVDPTNSDDAFDSLQPDSITVATASDDVAGFSVTTTDGQPLDTLVVTEGGSVLEFALVLSAQPSVDVVFVMQGDDETEVLATPPTVTFDSTNWSDSVTVVVTGVDDALIDGDIMSSITVSVNLGSDEDFVTLPSVVVNAVTLDDDTGGFTVTQTGGTSVSEGGTSDDFEVVLTAEPATDVVIDIATTNPLEVFIDTPTLTFNSANWAAPQTATVTGVDDLVADGD
ncbi:MAG: Ig-like domain-containing protein, partial [Longimicrobiales bacterium]